MTDPQPPTQSEDPPALPQGQEWVCAWPHIEDPEQLCGVRIWVLHDIDMPGNVLLHSGQHTAAVNSQGQRDRWVPCTPVLLSQHGNSACSRLPRAPAHFFSDEHRSHYHWV